MVVNIDHLCNVCEGNPGFAECCPACFNGVVRLPGGVVRAESVDTEIVIPPDDFDVYVVNKAGEVFVNSTSVGCMDVLDVLRVLDALGLTHYAEDFDLYDGTDCNEFVEETHLGDFDDYLGPSECDD